MARVYAIPADLAEYTGQAAPSDAEQLLARATRMLESAVLRLCWYKVDDAGMPTDPIVLAAIRDAVCAQVAWWDELGDSTGAAGAGWASVSIGPVAMSRSTPDVGPEASSARKVAPEVWDVLRTPDLTPDRFAIGVVVS